MESRISQQGRQSNSAGEEVIIVMRKASSQPDEIPDDMQIEIQRDGSDLPQRLEKSDESEGAKYNYRNGPEGGINMPTGSESNICIEKDFQRMSAFQMDGRDEKEEERLKEDRLREQHIIKEEKAEDDTSPEGWKY